MREIKFRGKPINNVGWAYGYYAKHETRQICPIGEDKLQPFEIKHLIVIDSFADWNMPRRLEGIEVIPETVGQSTGLKDKNGVEIYEGDIIKWLGYEVRFGRQIRPERIIYINDYIKDTYKILCITENTGKTVEVIGNIYDNPELMEEVE